MRFGSVLHALRTGRIVAFGLIVVIAICAVIAGLADLSAPWTVSLQVLSAVAGAALGNFIRHDFAQSAIRNQARPATRHLFDQVSRLRGLVLRAEAHQAAMLELGGSGLEVDWARTGDWFGNLGSSLRDEINATASAIENWGDLVPDVTDQELANYEARERRLPGQEGRVASDE